MKRSLIFLLLVSGFFIACSQENSKKSLEFNAEVFTGKWMTGEFAEASGMFFLAGQYGSIVRSENGLDWNYGDTPVTSTLLDIELDASGKIMLAVGEGGTILRSLDGGKVWQSVNINLPAGVEFSNTRLNAALYHPQKKVWLAAGTQNAILRSEDEGQNWELVSYNTGDDQLEILGLFVEPQTGDLLFAGQFGTTGRSSDAGITWDISKHDMEASGSYIPHIISFHQFEKVLIAFADEGRLLISDNAGKDWRLEKISTGGYFTDSTYDSKHKVIALTTQMGEVAISKDEGATWQIVTFDVDNWPSDDIPLLSNIIYDEKSESLVLVGNSGVIARSIDGGLTWFADIFKPQFNMSVTTLLHNPKTNVYVSAGLGGVIARSASLGLAAIPLENWEVVRPGIDQYIREIIHVPNSNTFVAVGQLGGIWRSIDDGKNWKALDVAYPFKNQPPHLRDIVRDAESGALIAAGPAGSIMRSTDSGETWTPAFQGQIHLGEAFTQVMYDKQRKAWLAIEVLYRTVYQSTDAGAGWQKIASIESDERNLWHGAISEKLGVTMVLGEKGGIAISHDGGFNWLMAETNAFNDFFGAFADDEHGVLLAVGQNGVILRSENGSDWQSVDSKTASTLRRAYKDPKTGAYLAFGQEGTIIRSTDAGLTWTPVTEKPVLNDVELRVAIQDAATGDVLLVGRDGVILRSADGGLSWQKINSHTTQHFRSAASNPQTGTVVVVGDTLVRLSK